MRKRINFQTRYEHRRTLKLVCTRNNNSIEYSSELRKIGTGEILFHFRNFESRIYQLLKYFTKKLDMVPKFQNQIIILKHTSSESRTGKFLRKRKKNELQNNAKLSMSHNVIYNLELTYLLMRLECFPPPTSSHRPET